jgi:hypothetical protein
MRISASRLAAVVAARFAPVVPLPFKVRAVGTEFMVSHPAGWGFAMPLDWIEDEDEDRSPAEMAELIVNNALNAVQDAVSEALTEPWPSLSPSGPPRAMAPYDTRCDGTNVYFWYGLSEQSPVLAFAPIPLTEVVHQE